MRMVGSAALRGTRVPGVGVLPPMCDLSVAAVWTRVRGVAYALVVGAFRVVMAVVLARRPAVAAPFASVRGRPVPLPEAPAAGDLQIPAPRSPGPVENGAPGHPSGPETVDPGRRHELALPADATAPRRARALLDAAAQEWGLDDDLHQDAAMVVTELVANAVDHACTSSTFVLGLDVAGLHVAVRDGRADLAPRPRPVDPTAPRGRGLQMVDALTGSWGVTVHPDGKTVWAVLSPE